MAYMAQFSQMKPKPWDPDGPNNSRPIVPSKRTTFKSRSPRRQEHQEHKTEESQTTVTFDNITERFTTFIEDKHIQTMNSVNKFLDVKVYHQKMQSDFLQAMEVNMGQTANVQEKTHIPPVMFEFSAHPFDDEQYQKYYYEYTGLAFNNTQNWCIWWKKHQDFGTWYTNIKTSEDKVMWVKYDVWWEALNTIQDIEETIRAFRVEYCEE